MDAEKHLQLGYLQKVQWQGQEAARSPLCVCREVFLLYKHADGSFV